MSVSISPNINQKRPTRRRLSLGIKMPLVVIALLMLAFVISTYFSAQATQNALVETLQNQLRMEAEARAELIRSNLNQARITATSLAAAAEVTQYDEATILKNIENTLRRNEHIFGATIAYEPYQYQTDMYYFAPYYSRKENGDLQFTQLGNAEYDYFSWNWYAQAKASGKPVLSAPYFDEGGGGIWMVTWSVPFYHQITGAFRGVATADIAFSQTQDIVNQIAVGKDGYAFLLDPQGIILGIGDNGGYYQAMESSMIILSRATKAQEWERLVNNMLTDEYGFVRAVDMQGRPMYVTYTQVEMDTGWSLGLAFAEKEVQAQATQARTVLIIYSGIVALVFGFIIFLFTLPLTQPLRRLTSYANKLSTSDLQTAEGRLLEPIQINTRDEVEDLAEAFNRMGENLSAAFESLEQKVAARTANIERSTLEFSIVAEIARDITIIRDLDTLLNVSANLIRERFNYYHVGIFMLDDHGEYAVLRAASSFAAQDMLDQNYRLKIGQGLVGNVIRTGQAHIAMDVGKDAVHFQNPFLPDTHSEIALPLRSHSVTNGALDIQTTLESAFDDHDVEILQLLADLLAAAIENAKLSEQVRNAITELNSTYRSQSQEAWQTDIKQREHRAYEYDGLQVRQVPPRLPEALLKKLESGKPIIFKENAETHPAAKKTLMVPILALNQMIGVIGLEQEDKDRTWTEEEIAIVQAAANRAALTLENARLLEDSQRRAVKERAIFEATERIGSALNIENILYATVEEIERVVSSSEVTLQFTTNDKNS